MGRSARGTRLLERDHELDQLGLVCADARAGRGRLVLVEGAAGTGKSVLLGAAGGRAAAAGLRVLDARGGELEQAFAFGAARQLFEAVVVEAEPAERARLLAGAAAPAARVLVPVGDHDPSGAGSRGPS